MENQEKGLTVNIGEYKGEKPIEVVYRIGNASKALDELPIKQPESFCFRCHQNSVGLVGKAFDTIDQKRANVKVNREKMSITLTVNEDDYYTKNTFVGTVELSEVFSKFGINDGERGWNPAKLGQFLRLNRGVFMQKEDCMKLVSVLKNFTANAKTEIQKQRDPSGSMAEVYRSQVESNLPKSFTINIAIFKGTAKTPIEVEFDHYLSNGDVLLQLVSPGANELAEDYRDKCIDEVLDGIRAIAPDIAILEI